MIKNAIENYTFGSIEHKGDNIFVIIMNEGIEVNKAVSEQVLVVLSEKIKAKSVLIIDKKNDYSYSGEGMMMLNDKNLKHVVGTAIVTYNLVSEMICINQVEIMRGFGRNNLSVFNHLNDAVAWAKEQIKEYTL